MSSSFLDALFSLSGRTAVVTGATRGIGQAIVIALAQAGAEIILIQRDASNKDTASQIETKTGQQAVIVICDLSKSDEVKTLIHRITASPESGGLGRTVDILVNCGGIQRRSPAENFPDEDWQDVLQVNLNSVWTLSRDAGRHMLETRGGVSDETTSQKNTAHHRGKIINVASLLSYQGGLTVPAYAAAKHGVIGMTQALSNEWSAKGINVNGIAPGYIATDMNTAVINNETRARQIMERIPAGRWGHPSDFEGVVVFLASRASDYVCGETIVVDGGWMGR